MSRPRLSDAPVVEVPKTLRGAHRFVTSTRETVTGRRAGSDHRIDLGRHPGVFRLVVARTNLARALLLLHALTREAERRDMEIAAVAARRYDSGAGVGIGAGGHVTSVEIHEATDRVPLSDEERARWREEHHRYSLDRDKKAPQLKSVANGRLKVVLPRRWDGRLRDDGPWQNTWGEGPTGPLDAKLGLVIEALLERAQADAVLAEERMRENERRRQAEHARQEREQRQRLEDARAERLRAEADAWRRADEVRAYLAALRGRLPELEGAERERVETWCAWAETYIERTDPVTRPELIQGIVDDRDRLCWPRSSGRPRL